MNWIQRIILLSVVFLLLEVEANSQCIPNEMLNLRKTALIIGQKNYKHVTQLRNTANDANDLSDSLKRLGFVVKTFIDTDLASMVSAIDDWCLKLPNFDVALFYYSGHGIEVDGINYLVPIDAQIQGESDLIYSAFSANKLLARMELASTRFNIMLLDACRNNPFAKNWNKAPKSQGLAAMTGKGAFIGFASAPGTVASDGDERNGVYTEAILKNLMILEQTIDQIFTKVNYAVRKKTNDHQIPYKNSSLSVDFCFNIKKSNKNDLVKDINSLKKIGMQVVLTENEDELLTIDTLDNCIKVWNSNTLIFKRRIVIDSCIPNKMILGKKGNIFVVDKSEKKIIKVAPDNTFQVVKFDSDCKYIIEKNDETICVFISDQKKIGEIVEISKETGKVLLRKELGPFFSIVFDFIGEVAYLLSKASDTLLLKYDYNKRVLQKAKLNVKSSTMLATNEKGIIVRLKENNRQLGILKGRGVLEMYKSELPENITHLCSFMDKIFLIAGHNILIYDTLTASPKILPFLSSPTAYTFSKDGHLYVWMNFESRPMIFDLKNLPTISPELSTEYEFEKLKSQLIRNAIAENQDYLRPIFTNVRSRINGVIKKIAIELQQEKIGQVISQGENFYSQYCCTYRNGISTSGGNRRVINSFLICVKKEYITVNIKEEDTNETSTVFIDLKGENWAVLDSSINKSIKRRIKKLFL